MLRKNYTLLYKNELYKIYMTYYNDNINNLSPTLYDLVDNENTDKNSLHSYLPIYQSLFEPRVEITKRIMEIGIHAGGSIKLWNDYFKNAIVHGVDCIEITTLPPVLYEMLRETLRIRPRIHAHFNSDAYSDYFINETFSNTGLKFDIIIDDGSHILEHMKFFVKNYINFLTPETGLLIVEDIPDIERIKELYDCVPEQYKKYCYYCDLRYIKGRFDDIMFFVDFSESCYYYNSEIKPVVI